MWEFTPSPGAHYSKDLTWLSAPQVVPPSTTTHPPHLTLSSLFPLSSTPPNVPALASFPSTRPSRAPTNATTQANFHQALVQSLPQTQVHWLICWDYCCRWHAVRGAASRVLLLTEHLLSSAASAGAVAPTGEADAAAEAAAAATAAFPLSTVAHKYPTLNAQNAPCILGLHNLRACAACVLCVRGVCVRVRWRPV